MCLDDGRWRRLQSLHEACKRRSPWLEVAERTGPPLKAYILVGVPSCGRRAWQLLALQELERGAAASAAVGDLQDEVRRRGWGSGGRGGLQVGICSCMALGDCEYLQKLAR